MLYVRLFAPNPEEKKRKLKKRTVRQAPGRIEMEKGQQENAKPIYAQEAHIQVSFCLLPRPCQRKVVIMYTTTRLPVNHLRGIGIRDGGI